MTQNANDNSGLATDKATQTDETTHSTTVATPAQSQDAETGPLETTTQASQPEVSATLHKEGTTPAENPAPASARTDSSPEHRQALAAQSSAEEVPLQETAEATDAAERSDSIDAVETVDAMASTNPVASADTSTSTDAAESEDSAESTDPVDDVSPSALAENQATVASTDALSHHDALALLKEGKPLVGLSLPFLTLQRKHFEHPIVLEDCKVQGILARGTKFDGGLTFRNCVFQERVQFRVHDKRGELTPCQINGDVTIEHCTFRDNMGITHSDLDGRFMLSTSQVHGELQLSRSTVSGNVVLEAKNEIATCAFYRARFAQSLTIKDCTLGVKKQAQDKGSTKAALDLGRTHIDGVTVIEESRFLKDVSFARGHFGRESHNALLVQRSTFHTVKFDEAAFYGDVKLEELHCHGKMSAAPPHRESNTRKGRPSLFSQDFTAFRVHFHDKCDFYNARFLGFANFRHCQFEMEASFNHSDFEKGASFWESKAKAALHFRKCSFGGMANFGHTEMGARSSFNDTHFHDKASFFELKARGDVFFTNAVFDAYLKLNQATFEGGLSLKNATVGGDLTMTQTQLQDRCILEGLTLHGALQAPGLSIGTWGSLVNAKLEGPIDLRGLNVGSRIPEESLKHPYPSTDITSAPTQEIEQPRTQKTEQPDIEKGAGSPTLSRHAKKKKANDFVPGSFYFDGASIRQSLRLQDAALRGSLTMPNLDLGGECEMTRLRVGHTMDLSHSIFRDTLRLSGTECRGDINAYKMRCKENVSIEHVLCHNLGLSSSAFDQNLNLRSSTIKDALTMNQTSVEGKADLTRCKTGRFFFEGLMADYLVVQRTMLGAQTSSEKAGNFAQARNEYSILKQSFLQRSQYHDMDWAYYRFCRAHRKAKPLSWRSPLQAMGVFFDWLLLDLGFGYGTRPMNIAGVTLGLLLVFTGLFFAFPQCVQNAAGQAASQVALSDAFYLSLVTFSSMDYIALAPNAAHWMKFVFALEGLLGIFMVTLFVATISRKIIRT